MRRVAIRYGSRLGWAYLRELRGVDEESVEGTETDVAIRLLDRLLLPVDGAAVMPGHAATLCAADRDRLLAAVYLQAVGRRIAAHAACAGCGQPFDLDFDLIDLLASLDAAAVREWRGPDGTFETPAGLRFRLPTGAEEVTDAGGADPERQLADRCRIGGDADLAALADAMAAVAPLVDVELAATCPACAHQQTVRFDIQAFLLGRLLVEQRERAREVHAIARAYGWGLAEILDLPRPRRADYVELIERHAAGR